MEELVAEVSLRAITSGDLPVLRVVSPDDDPFDFFGYVASNALERAFAADGLIGADFGTLAVEDAEGALAGKVSWRPVPHGPSITARALNVGIRLLPQFRSRGLGTAAQAMLAAYLFDTTLFERLQAETDVDNVAEQRALEKAGFQREGIARHAQYRFGTWHDVVVYSRLRGDVYLVAGRNTVAAP
jgi:RimJ/RimL family protein N-acetyltransferase